MYPDDLPVFDLNQRSVRRDGKFLGSLPRAPKCWERQGKLRSLRLFDWLRIHHFSPQLSRMGSPFELSYSAQASTSGLYTSLKLSFPAEKRRRTTASGTEWPP